MQNRPLVSLSVGLSHPESRGFVRLKSAEARTPPEIHPRLLDAEVDVKQLSRGVEWARRVIATPPLAAHVVRQPERGPGNAGFRQIADEVRATAEPLYHSAGTCRMGSDRGAVVQPDLRVTGTERLWLADTSIFPRHISGNTHATALMIGKRAAELIRAGLAG